MDEKMALPKTAEDWIRDLIWVNETNSKNGFRSATIPKYNSKAGATLNRFRRRYIRSLLALSFTDEFQSLAGETKKENFIVDALNPVINRGIKTNFDLLSTLEAPRKQDTEWNSVAIYDNLFTPHIFDIESKPTRFLLYFMVSFFNLNHLTKDYHTIYKKMKKESWETWTKTAYFNQTIAEIYREDFFFTILLECLNLAMTQEDAEKNILSSLKSIYNHHLNYYTKIYKTQYSNFVNQHPDGDEIPKWFGNSTWTNNMEGELTFTTFRSIDIEESFTLPEHIVTLNKEEAESAFKLIYELFIINAHEELIRQAIIRNDSGSYSYDITEMLLSLEPDDISKISQERIQQMRYYLIEPDFHRSQHIHTLYQAHTTDAEQRVHFIVNPHIETLMNRFFERFENHPNQVKFIKILT